MLFFWGRLGDTVGESSPQTRGPITALLHTPLIKYYKLLACGEDLFPFLPLPAAAGDDFEGADVTHWGWVFPTSLPCLDPASSHPQK